jgi:Glycosyl transferase family 11
MIKVRNIGRFGNNLFQFAFGYATARELRTNFCMDEMGWFHLFKNRTYWQLKNRLLLKFWQSSPRKEFDFTNNDIDPKNRLQELRNCHSYRGYFQSERYFIKYEKELRKIFQFRKQFIRRMEEEFKPLLKNQKILLINVRGGDYQSLPFLLPRNYYFNAYQRLKKCGFEPDCILIITDDREYADRLLDFIPNKTFIPNPSMEKDFFWLTQANALIIPNSSFSWWGAWLNAKSKVTIAPKNWLGWKEGKEYPVGIMHSSWRWINVENESSA